MDTTAIQSLSNVTEDGNALVVVGAHISNMVSGGSPVTTLDGLVENALRFLIGNQAISEEEQEVIYHDASNPQTRHQVLGLLHDTLAEKDLLETWLKMSFDSLQVISQRLHEGLFGLKLPLATRNLDTLIEQSGQQKAVAWQDGTAVNQFFSQGAGDVLHFQGVWNRPDSTSFYLDFEKLKQNFFSPAVKKVVSELKAIVFVGSFGDLLDGDLELLRLLSEYIGSAEAKIFLVCPSENLTVIEELGLSEIYETIYFADEQGLIEILQSCAVKKREPVVPKPNLGTLWSFNREAGDAEKCLNVDKYAAVIAELLSRNRKGEFSLGIFGHWGRGKTYLMREVERTLAEPPYNLVDAGFRTVWFSAWKYPARPVIWAFLYQTIFKVATADSFMKTACRTFRANMFRNGPWSLLAMLFGLLLAFSWQLPKLITKDAELLGPLALLAPTVLTLLTAYWKLFSKQKDPLKTVFQKYGRLPDHKQHLGLQALVGEDLQALLNGWLVTGKREAKTLPKSDPFHRNRPGVLWFILVSMVLALLSVSIVYQTKFSSDWGQIALASTLMWLGLMILGVLLFRCGWEKKQLVLVVDDLDRLPLDDMLHVIESLKLLLEEPSLTDKIRLILLVDDGPLRLAIRKKHAEYVADLERRMLMNKPSNEDVVESEALPVDVSGISAEKVIERENLEKLLLAHFRLGRLNQTGINEVVKAYLPEEIRASRPVTTRKTSAPVPDRTITKVGNPGIPNLANPNVNQPKPEPGDQPTAASTETLRKGLSLTNAVLSEKLAPFSTNERETIQKLFANRSVNHRWSPRAIRVFLFQYQLAREIYKIRSGTAAVDIDLLVKTLLNVAENPGAIDRIEDSVLRATLREVN